MHYVPPQLLLCILQGILYGSTQVNACKHFNDEGHNNRRTLLQMLEMWQAPMTLPCLCMKQTITQNGRSYRFPSVVVSQECDQQAHALHYALQLMLWN